MSYVGPWLRVTWVAVFTFCLSAIHASAYAQGQPLTFSAFGDIPYGNAEYSILQQYVIDHNRYSPSAFIIHIGDMLTGTCSENKYSEVANIMKGFAVPAYIVVGDNEYNDCGNPVQALSHWKEYFLNFEKGFCGAALTEHQDVRPENLAFVMNGVLFIGINLVGGAIHDQNEWNMRMQNDADWVSQQFQAKVAQVRAAVVFAQAGPENGNRNLFFDQFRSAAATFGKPILFIQGNTHAYKLAQPWPEKNISQLVVPAGKDEPPLEVTVTMNSNPQSAFTIKRRPWDSTLVNMPPCVDAGPDEMIAYGTPATLRGRAADDGDPPGTLTTAWSEINGPGTVTFENNNALETTASFSAQGLYVLRLTVDDGELQASDDVIIGVDHPVNLSSPSISSFSPGSGTVGSVVTITGSNFTGATGVAFNGTTTTSFAVNSDTKILAAVPAGALTGKISVVNSAGTGVGANDFVVVSGGLTFYPTDDAYVQSMNAASNFGAATKLRVETNNVSDVSYTYLKFNVTGVIGPMESAKVRLKCADGSAQGGSFFLVSNNYQNTGNPWLESSLTWNNAPVIAGNALSTLGAVISGETVEVDVTAAITGNGIYSLALKNNTTNAVLYNSKEEQALHPELIIQSITTPPNIIFFTPSKGLAGTEVTIIGSRFTGATAVAFNGVADSNMVVISDTKIRATVPLGETTGKISITNSVGTRMSATNFTVIASPVITSFTPTNGPVESEVIIKGRHFTGVSSVTFDGKAATTFSVDSDVRIRANVPTDATTGKIGLVNPAGNTLSTKNFVVRYPPIVTSFAPSNAPMNKLVTIMGSYFVGATSVTFNGTPAAFTVFSNIKIQATVPEEATTGKFAVITPWGIAESSSDFLVTVTPVIASIMPTAGLVGMEVIINGNHFAGTTRVTFNGITASFLGESNSRIRATIPAGASTGRIRVINSAGFGVSPINFVVTTSTDTSSFIPQHDTFVRRSTPTTNYGAVSSLRQETSSSEASQTYLKFEVTSLNGNLLRAKLRLYAASASVDGGSVYLVSPHYKSTATPWIESGLIWDNAPDMGDTALISAPPGGVSAGTWVELEVTPTIVGNGIYAFGLKNNSVDAVTYNSKESDKPPQLIIETIASLAPSITSFAPADGPIGTEVKIIGKSLSKATEVTFNNTPADFRVVSNSAIRATVPNGVPLGGGKIKITNLHGSSSHAQDFTVTAPPAITAFTPNYGTEGDEIVITGSHFTGTRRVTFRGIAAAIFFVDSDFQIRAQVPAGVTMGKGKIGVFNSAGGALSASDFEVLGPPLVFAPKYDAYTKSSNPTTNFGDAGTLRQRLSANEIMQTYLAFEVSGLSGTGLSAKLRLYVNDASPDGGSVYTVSPNYKNTMTPWTENGLNWNNAPPITGTALSTVGVASLGKWMEYDVTPAIVGNGAYFLGIKNNHSDEVYFSSKEGDNVPQLVIQRLSNGASGVTAFAPTNGPAGTQVTIKGINLSGATQVTFSDVPAGFNIVADTLLIATVPDGAAPGESRIKIINSQGAGSHAQTFTITVPPMIFSFAPTEGIEGTAVMISGSRFTATTNVTFNGMAATTFFVDSDSLIRANVPAGLTPGKGKIVVTNSAGGTASADDFTVNTLFTFAPQHDAYVKSSDPAGFYGTGGTLRTQLGASEIIRAYLKFAVTGLTGTLRNAKLRLYVTNASVDGGMLYSVSRHYKNTTTLWVESGLNWNNAPNIAGTALDTLGVTNIGQWVEFEVTPAIVGNGIYSFGLKNSHTDAVYYSSKEGANAPQLIIQTAPGSTAKRHSNAPEDDMAIPDEFVLEQNYPNPFNPGTSIHSAMINFSLPTTGKVTLQIFNETGQLVRTLVDREIERGKHTVRWDARDQFNRAVAAGVYFYRMTAVGKNGEAVFSKTQRMTMVK